LNTFKTMPSAKSTPKAEETGLRILDSALELFRQEGFDKATMRDVAEKAGVATGAAYYYYPSKDAIVMDFYGRSSEDMQPKIETALEGAKSLDARLSRLIQVKLAHFGPNRGVLRALLRNGADPDYPLSPFSAQTKEIRDTDVAWFRRILTDCGIRIPRDLEPHLPGVLWLFQMGVIFFWVIDDSPNQSRTTRLLELSVKSVVFLIRASALPLMRPIRKTVLRLIVIARGDAHGND
jgi:AcrR family transcriptional regulator